MPSIKCFLSACFITLIFALNAQAETIDDPCAGPSALLAMIDRPTASYSACVVPYGNLILEAGYQYQELSDTGNQQNFPEAELRIGLPFNTEIMALLPNYIRQTSPLQTGYDATTIGLKHEIGYNEHWLAAVNALLTLPSGGDNFGSNGTGGTINEIISYSFNPQWNLNFMLGESTTVVPHNSGGQRYESINPDVVLTWTAKEKISFYGEVYGQTKAGPGLGSGYNFNGGIIYLLFKNVALDLEVGQRLSGQLEGYNHYIGTGFSVLI